MEIYRYEKFGYENRSMWHCHKWARLFTFKQFPVMLWDDKVQLMLKSHRKHTFYIEISPNEA